MPYYNNSGRCHDASSVAACGQKDNTQWDLARTYVVVQSENSPTYDIETAFTKGTIYKDLDKPFLGGCRR